VIFAVQKLKSERSSDEVSEDDLFDYILNWKKTWKQNEEKQTAVAETIRNLEMLNWVRLKYSERLPALA
jgi:hypothetical protein